MARILVIFGTTEGQTAKIAEAVAGAAREAGASVDVLEIPKRGEVEAAMQDYDGIIVGASVHRGEHQRHVREFIELHRDELASVPNAFFSVSLAAADPEPASQAEAVGYVEKLRVETGWRPDEVATFAGALAFSHYDLFTRVIMRLIAKKQGMETEGDQEYTDWDGVASFAQGFVTRLPTPASRAI